MSASNHFKFFTSLEYLNSASALRERFSESCISKNNLLDSKIIMNKSIVEKSRIPAFDFVREEILVKLSWIEQQDNLTHN